MSFRIRRSLLLAVSPFVLLATPSTAQVALPEIVVSTPSPIQRPATAPATGELQGTLPVVTDQFATVTVVPDADIRRSGAATLGDLLFGMPGITGSGFAPGASSRPIIRGLDVNRVRIQENGIGANGASDLGEDHFVPVDPLSIDRVEVIRGPASLRFGPQAIGGVVETTNNRIPTAIPKRGISTELRGAASSVDSGHDGAVLLDAGAGNVAIHADAFARNAQDYRIPGGRQANSAARANGQSVGGSYIFDNGFVGAAIMQNNALYHIPTSEGAEENARIDANQTKILTKGEWRSPGGAIDAIRFWGGFTDYKHDERGLEDTADPGSDTVHQTFTNKEQEGRVEMQLAPFNLRFAALTTAIGVQGGHQKLTASSPDGIGLWDPNSNRRIAGYMFNEFKFTDTTKAQLAGRIERVDLDGTARSFDVPGVLGQTPASLGFTPKSVSLGLIQNLPLDLVASITGQYVERAPKPAELFSGGSHHATETFDKGNIGLGIEAAQSLELGLRRATGPFRFEATAYVTKYKGFIYRRLTGNTCDDAGDCSLPDEELSEAIFSQRDATFRGVELQSQWDLLPVAGGVFGVENQFDLVRATFSDGTNVPRIPPMRLGGGAYWRDANWLARVRLIHAFAQNDIAAVAETTTPAYDDLRAEVSYTWNAVNPRRDQLSAITVGINGTNLLNRTIRNSASYSKDEVVMPGLGVRLFASVKY